MKSVDDLVLLITQAVSFDRERAERAWAQWLVVDKPKFLAQADRTGLTLHLWRIARANGFAEKLADAQEFEERLRKNKIRLARRKGETAELLEIFRKAGLRAAVLKGFTLEPDFVPTAEDRVQYDLDFYLSPEDARAAFDLLRARSYEPMGNGRRPLDHLPALVRKTGWQWRGDFFDIDIPAAVELHFQLWDAEFERIPVEFSHEPLTRLVDRAGFPALHPHDQLASCVLHAVRHVFRGSLRLSHLYEIAWFIEHSGAEFWREWRESMSFSMRRLCAGGLALAAGIFRARTTHIEAELVLLPDVRVKWIADVLSRLILEAEKPSKAEILLQLSYVDGWRNQLRVLQRRLLPLALPDSVNGLSGTSGRPSVSRRVSQAARQARFTLGRALHHAQALPRFARVAARWRRL